MSSPVPEHIKRQELHDVKLKHIKNRVKQTQEMQQKIIQKDESTPMSSWLNQITKDKLKTILHEFPNAPQFTHKKQMIPWLLQGDRRDFLEKRKKAFEDKVGNVLELKRNLSDFNTRKLSFIFTTLFPVGKALTIIDSPVKTELSGICEVRLYQNNKIRNKRTHSLKCSLIGDSTYRYMFHYGMFILNTKNIWIMPSKTNSQLLVVNPYIDVFIQTLSLHIKIYIIQVTGIKQGTKQICQVGFIENNICTPMKVIHIVAYTEALERIQFFVRRWNFSSISTCGKYEIDFQHQFNMKREALETMELILQDRFAAFAISFLKNVQSYL